MGSLLGGPWALSRISRKWALRFLVGHLAVAAIILIPPNLPPLVVMPFHMKYPPPWVMQLESGYLNRQAFASRNKIILEAKARGTVPDTYEQDKRLADLKGRYRSTRGSTSADFLLAVPLCLLMWCAELIAAVVLARRRSIANLPPA
jgi:hypothetical protein